MIGAVKSGKLKFLVLLVAVCLACTITFAENGNEYSGEREILTTFEQRMQKRISIDFRETPIGDVIRIMAEQADVDIIKSPKVTGNVTTTLTDVPLGEALSNILTTHGYSYVTTKNMVRIAPIEEIIDVSERLVSRIYRITYADIGEVEKALKKFLSKLGSLSSNPSSSNIIITDTETKIKVIDKFIEEIDRITPQIMVEVRIYDITIDEDFDLDIPWDVARNTPITATSVTDVLSRDKTINHLTGLATVDTTATDYDATETTATVWRDDGTSYRKSKPFVGGSYDETEGGSIRFGLLNDIVDVEFVLNILHEQDLAELLANPRILVLDNETAEFKIVREIPYRQTSDTSAGGSLTSIQFKEVGIHLQVTPHLTRDGMIRLHVIPEFGVDTGVGVVAVGEDEVPAIDTRRVDTIALVKDGQTVVVGGLRKRETTQDVWKVPIFGDIPLLGGLFQSRTESIETNELVIFITPRIVIEPTLSPRELERFKDSEVPSPKRPKLTLDSLD